MKAERLARFVVAVLVIALPTIAVLARSDGSALELHARLAEDGGWTPSNITATAGRPLHLRLTSDDVTHGFAIGQSVQPAINVLPGQWTETTLMFDAPGKYTFYCTRWCGPSHWRMRGTIEVSGTPAQTATPIPPLYVTLKLNIDDPHPADILPAEKPSAARGAALDITPDLPCGLQSESARKATGLPADAYRTQSPVGAWHELRSTPFSNGLSDEQVWDLVAWMWRSNASSQSLVEGKQLYTQNCAACHGETGQGNGVMAASLDRGIQAAPGQATQRPADFTDAQRMLGASSAILQGKIMRGGMGTGMPYWGPIFTESQIWSLIAYLWTFEFE